MKTLDQLVVGQSAAIARIVGEDGVSCRLREMGFVSGQRVRLLNVAPLGGPMNCFIQGSRIAVRRTEAARVWLAVADDQGADDQTANDQAGNDQANVAPKGASR